LNRGENNVGSYYTKDELVLDGKILAYFLTAYSEFSKTQSNVGNFEILILETDTEIRITFVAKNDLGEEIALGGRTSLGESVSYYISKEGQNITGWHVHR